MKLRSLIAIAAVVAGVVLLFAQINAQNAPAAGAGVQRTVVERGDVSIPGREAVGISVEIAPGARTGRHTHPGDEIDYVIEGTGELLIDGKPAKALKAGIASVIPGGTIHDAHNNSTQPLKIWAVFHVEKGKPITAPVQ